MQVTRTQRQEAEKNITATQEQLFSSVEAGQRLRAIATNIGITSDKPYTIFAVTVGDLILKLVPQNQLRTLFEERLPGISQDKLEILEKELSVFLAPLADNEELEDDISSLETTINQLEPMRTMQGDIKAHTPPETTHQSSQDSLLQKDDTPRWDSV